MTPQGNCSVISPPSEEEAKGVQSFEVAHSLSNTAHVLLYVSRYRGRGGARSYFSFVSSVLDKQILAMLKCKHEVDSMVRSIDNQELMR